MKIKKNINYICSIDEAVKILNSKYTTLHVKTLDWYEKNKNAFNYVEVPGFFVPEMKKFCGVISPKFKAELSNDYIDIIFDDREWSEYKWSLNMFEEFNNFNYENKEKETLLFWV